MRGLCILKSYKAQAYSKSLKNSVKERQLGLALLYELRSLFINIVIIAPLNYGIKCYQGHLTSQVINIRDLAHLHSIYKQPHCLS